LEELRFKLSFIAHIITPNPNELTMSHQLKMICCTPRREPLSGKSRRARVASDAHGSFLPGATADAADALGAVVTRFSLRANEAWVARVSYWISCSFRTINTQSTL
jgi:hypothetical protein